MSYLLSVLKYGIIFLKGREFRLKKFFKDTSNFLSFALAIVPSVLLYIFQPSKPIPYSAFVISVLINLLLGWLSVKLLLDSKEVSHPAIELFKCSNGKCLCKSNPYLSFRSVVSFYESNNGFEKFLCHGFVETITERGLPQIVILDDKEDEFFSYIANHQSNIIIKPTVSIDAMRSM